MIRTTVPPHETYWNTMQTILRSLVDEAVYEEWMRSLKFENVRTDGTLELSVPTTFLKTWLSERYAPQLLKAGRIVFGDITAVAIVVRPPGGFKSKPTATVRRPPDTPRSAPVPNERGLPTVPTAPRRREQSTSLVKTPAEQATGLTPEEKCDIVVTLVAQHYKKSAEKLRSMNTSDSHRDAQQLAIYIASETINMDYEQLGTYFGGRQSWLIAHMVGKAKEKIFRSRVAFGEVQTLLKQVRARIKKT